MLNSVYLPCLNMWPHSFDANYTMKPGIKKAQRGLAWVWLKFIPPTALEPSTLKQLQNRKVKERQQEPVSVHRLRMGNCWFLRLMKVIRVQQFHHWLTLSCSLEWENSITRRCACKQEVSVRCLVTSSRCLLLQIQTSLTLKVFFKTLTDVILNSSAITWQHVMFWGIISCWTFPFLSTGVKWLTTPRAEHTVSPALIWKHSTLTHFSTK